MSVKTKNLDNTFGMISGISDHVKQSKAKQRAEHIQVVEKKPFKKPRGDYYNLDMVVRDTELGAKGHPVMTEQIKTNYKEYVSIMASAEGVSMTKYIHKLIDEDMERNSKKYKQLIRIKNKGTA